MLSPSSCPSIWIVCDQLASMLAGSHLIHISCLIFRHLQFSTTWRSCDKIYFFPSAVFVSSTVGEAHIGHFVFDNCSTSCVILKGNYEIQCKGSDFILLLLLFSPFFSLLAALGLQRVQVVAFLTWRQRVQPLYCSDLLSLTFSCLTNLIHDTLRCLSFLGCSCYLLYRVFFVDVVRCWSHHCQVKLQGNNFFFKWQLWFLLYIRKRSRGATVQLWIVKEEEQSSIYSSIRPETDRLQVLSHSGEEFKKGGGGVEAGAPALICSLFQKKKNVIVMPYKLFILKFIFVVCTDVSI